ncbi:hypothetical protein BLNAU_11093 [Blattamonas nauphoetae]|uniref:Uncharacterized protein n=1 Tax=Blattamonas nauphoetae TaxID=2049346 RepID=A0ABQ9XNJ2_9EUKA|nr:hypothetical protein BLNAU_11093 [Blattamonas nauphoetae]
MSDFVTPSRAVDEHSHDGVSYLRLSLLLDHAAFMNWDGQTVESASDRLEIYQSLVALIKYGHDFDFPLEAKAVIFLNSVSPKTQQSADAFLNNFASVSDHSSTNFVQSIGMLVSSPSQVITTAALNMLKNLLTSCSPRLRLDLVQADLIPQVINSLDPVSLSFAEAVDIHIYLNRILNQSVRLTTLFGLEKLGIEDGNEPQAVFETILKQVIIPSEKYICHLCVNRFSIVDYNQSEYFLTILAQILRICPYHQPTMDFVLHMPVTLTIPSCLTSFVDEESIWYFVVLMINSQRGWNTTVGTEQQMSKIVHRMLRMEGIEDVNEEKLGNDKTGEGGWIVDNSISWNNLLGMNLQKQE